LQPALVAGPLSVRDNAPPGSGEEVAQLMTLQAGEPD
jgi:hypothetical protein